MKTNSVGVFYIFNHNHIFWLTITTSLNLSNRTVHIASCLSPKYGTELSINTLISILLLMLYFPLTYIGQQVIDYRVRGASNIRTYSKFLPNLCKPYYYQKLILSEILHLLIY